MLNVVVRQRCLEGQAIVSLKLVDPLGHSLPEFTAGAHIDVHLPQGLIRQYSLCGDPRDRESYRLAVLKDPASRGGSVAVHEFLQEGSSVVISQPKNHFKLAADAAHSVLVGGGIGITPMVSMAWELHASGRSFELHYCCRSRDKAGLLGVIENAPWSDHVHLYFDDDGEKLALSDVLDGAPSGRHIYVCGPSGFMSWVMDEARGAGLSPAEIHKEFFAAPTSVSDTEDVGFELVASRSGKSVRVASDQSVLDALRAIGIKVEVSCEEGVCGTCLCNVLEGIPDHRDAYLTDDEKAANDQMLVCCSRSKSERLVLDV